jgi:hypothetical protein
MSRTSGGRRRSISAIACVSGSEPACSPGEERFVRFSSTRRSVYGEQVDAVED